MFFYFWTKPSYISLNNEKEYIFDQITLPRQSPDPCSSSLPEVTVRAYIQSCIFFFFPKLQLSSKSHFFFFLFFFPFQKFSFTKQPTSHSSFYNTSYKNILKYFSKAFISSTLPQTVSQNFYSLPSTVQDTYILQ